MAPYVNEFVIIDTGSTAVDIAKMKNWNYEAFPPVHVFSETFEDFSTTRNKGLLRHKYDWTIAFDPDELPSMQMMHHIAVATSEAGKAKAPSVIGWQYWTMNWWDGKLGKPMDYHWHIRAWKTKGSFLYRPVHELVAVQGHPETITRATSWCPRAPVEAYLIHSKSAEELEEADALYEKMGDVSR